MSKGLSILIPVYNFPVTPLIESLHRQAQAISGLHFEIRCLDDGSSSHFENSAVASLENVVYKANPANKGRAATRNLLAGEARYDSLLFLDCDAEIVHDEFIANYLKHAEKPGAVIGGTVYSDTLPSPDVALRWKYGKAREEKRAAVRQAHPYRSLTINNLLIPKSIYGNTPLDEGITSYGHEDTKFGYELREKGVPVWHIDNPVRHIGLESNAVFLQKTQTAIENFYLLMQREGIGKDTQLYRAFRISSLPGVKWGLQLFFRLCKKHIEKNLLSNNPSIRYFDGYKLGLLLQQKSLH